MATPNATNANGRKSVTIQTLVDAGQNLTKLGYIVRLSMTGVEVKHDELVQAMTAAGFTESVPNSVTAKMAMQRSIAAWLRSKDVDVQDDDEVATNKLIRKIQSAKSDVVVFVLSTESIDYRELGLSYATELRIRLEKPKARTSHGQDLSKTKFICTTAATGSFDAVQEAADIEAELQPFWQKYSAMATGTNITESLLMLLTKRMSAVSLMARSGLYFVPVAHEAELLQLQTMVENLPNTGEGKPMMIAIPQIDVDNAKAELARASFDGMMREIQDTQTSLNRILNADPGTVRVSTVNKFLKEFAGLARKAKTYADLLDMRVDNLNKTLSGMMAQAKAVITAESVAADADVDAAEAAKNGADGGAGDTGKADDTNDTPATPVKSDEDEELWGYGEEDADTLPVAASAA